jgi:hypothetical protein
MANTTANSWDEASPAITDPRREGAVEITSLRKAVRLRLDKEHAATLTGGVGGEHKEGSAKVYFEASAPTMRPDGTTSLSSDDAGRLWLDSDTLVLYCWDGNSWEEIVPGTVDNIRHFEEINNSGGLAVASLPMTATGLTAGTYQVVVYGTTAGSPSESSSYDISVTCNGVTRTLTIDNHPDGTAPFSIPFTVTVTTTCAVTATSNVSRILGMMGVRVG